MPNNEQKKLSLSYKILLYILVFSSAISIIMTAFQLYVNFKQDKVAIDSGINSAQLSSSAAISHSLWLMEEDILEIQLSGLVRTPYIDRAEIIENDRTISQAGSDSQGGFTKKFSYPLTFGSQENNQESSLGELIITANYNEAYDNLIRQAGIIFISQVIKTFFVSMFILFVLHRLILRHLAEIADYLRDFSEQTFPKGLTQKLVLRRKDKDDELGLLENEINHLRQKLHWHLNALDERELALNQEIKLRKSTEKLVKDQFKLVNNILDSMKYSILTVDNKGILQQCNVMAQEQFSIRKNDKPDIRDVFRLSANKQLKIDDDNTQSDIDVQNLIISGDSYFYGFCSVINSGKEFPASLVIRNTLLPNGNVAKVLIIVDESNTERIKEISYNASHDLLTGLLNRYRFSEILNKRANDLTQGLAFTLAFIDMDNFKSINDVFGHMVGDNVIRSVATCISSTLDKNDVAARLGGDEFVLLINGDIDHSQRKLEELLENLNSIKINTNDEDLYLTASIGVTAAYPGDTDETLINRADKACYKVKRNGGGGISIGFNNDVLEEKKTSSQHYQLIKQVKQAVQDNDIDLYVQDILPISSDKDLPNRVEVLIRFSSQHKGLTPASVVPVTDQYHVTPKIDLWVIENLHRLIIDGQVSQLYLNINLSAQSLYSHAISEKIHALLDTCQVSGHQICFEITESSLIRNLQVAQQFIEGIRKKGGLFALDDFGVGYASFGTLKNLPLDILKLDGSLIVALDDEEQQQKTQKIITSIYQMAVSLNLETVAEHTVSESTLAWLQQLGIDYSQSYLHSRPRPLAQV